MKLAGISNQFDYIQRSLEDYDKVHLRAEEQLEALRSGRYESVCGGLGAHPAGVIDNASTIQS